MEDCGFVSDVVKWVGIGPSPSGKALGFGPSIRRFESCRSSQAIRERPKGSLFDGFCLDGQDENRRFDRRRSRVRIQNLFWIIRGDARRKGVR